jgi:hypothetical protein
VRYERGLVPDVRSSLLSHGGPGSISGDRSCTPVCEDSDGFEPRTGSFSVQVKGVVKV